MMRTVLAAALFGVLSTLAHGAEATYKVDPVHTTIMFRIRHAQVSWFYGRFDRAGGTFVLDGHGAPARLDVYVEAASVNTNHPERDKVVRGPQFFNAEKFPKIRFVSRKITPAGKDRWRVEGALTIRDVTRPLTVELEKVGEADTRIPGGHRAGLHTVFTIRRSEFDMGILQNALGDEVRLYVGLEGVRVPE